LANADFIRFRYAASIKLYYPFCAYSDNYLPAFFLRANITAQTIPPAAAQHRITPSTIKTASAELELDSAEGEGKIDIAAVSIGEAVCSELGVAVETVTVGREVAAAVLLGRGVAVGRDVSVGVIGTDVDLKEDSGVEL